MTKYAVFVLVFFLLAQVHGQEKFSLGFNEFSISINRTLVKDGNTEDRYGFGFGAIRTFLPTKGFNVTAGFEFNKTVQKKKIVHFSSMYTAYEVTDRLYILSLPATLRFNFGKKIKFFAEIGIFLDLHVGGCENGVADTYAQDSNYNFYRIVYKYKKTPYLSSTNYGPSFGIGLKFPMAKYFLLVKTDYKLGMNNLSGSLENFKNRYLRLVFAFQI
jgi:hypothetical protein